MRCQDWSVAVVVPSRFESKLVTDILRNAGIDRVRAIPDGEGALTQLSVEAATGIVLAFDSAEFDALAWVRMLRRMENSRSRKAPVFVLVRKLTATVAEACRHAGANAVIGTPLSSSVLLNTMSKVLAKPRPFVEAAGYVGPCRRAGIVTAGKGARAGRRLSDDTSDGQAA